MGPVDYFKSKLDIYRLEQRYTKRRDRRTHFSSGARYIDGEYFYGPKDENTGMSRNRRPSSATSTSSSTWPRSPFKSSAPLPPVSTAFGTATAASGVTTSSPAPWSPHATFSSSAPPSSAGSSPSRPHRTASPSERHDAVALGGAGTGLRTRSVDHESYTGRGSGLGLGTGPTPFSGDADSAWERLPEQHHHRHHGQDPRRKSLLQRGVDRMT